MQTPYKISQSVRVDDEMIFDDVEDANMDGGEDVENAEGVGGSCGVCVGDDNHGDEVGRCGGGSDVGVGGQIMAEGYIWVEMVDVVMVIRV